MKPVVIAVITALVSVILLGATLPEAPTVAPSQMSQVAHFPHSLNRSCGNGRAQLYDECGSQAALLRSALEEAKRTGKVVIVSYGAEWCIWCHVFDAHLRGGTGRFQSFSNGRPIQLVERAGEGVVADARTLNEYAARNLVVAHIESDNAPDGFDVLARTGATKHFKGGLPYIFSVTTDGKYAASVESDRVEVRRDELLDPYRGYDRRKLLAELMRLRDAACRKGCKSAPTSR